jgi:cobalt ECF transporter T component CbiQ
LRYAYPNGVLGLAGVDLHVTHGERVAILGPNGAGKTTLMLHLNALLKGSGELEVAGLNVARDDVRDLRTRVGLVFQDPDDQLFMPTVREGDPVDLGPFTVSEQGLATLATVSAKAVLGTLSAVMLGATTSFPDVLHALERLRAPRLLVLIAAFMYRYLFVIVEEVSRMRAALAARGYAPRHALQAAAIGRVATALFLRTYERAERVHLAMLARGWRQTMPRLDTLAFTRTDTLFLAALATPLLATRILI